MGQQQDHAHRRHDLQARHARVGQTPVEAEPQRRQHEHHDQGDRDAGERHVRRTEQTEPDAAPDDCQVEEGTKGGYEHAFQVDGRAPLALRRRLGGGAHIGR
jgi:hypothetical protein